MTVGPRRVGGPGSVSGDWIRALVQVACSLSPHPPLLHSPPAHPLGALHLQFRPPPSSWHLTPQLCRGRGTLPHYCLHCFPLSLGSSPCSGSRCQRGGDTTDGCGRRCRGPSGWRPPEHTGTYAGQRAPRGSALIVSSVSQCQCDRHCPADPSGNTGHKTCMDRERGEEERVHHENSGNVWSLCKCTMCVVLDLNTPPSPSHLDGESAHCLCQPVITPPLDLQPLTPTSTPNQNPSHCVCAESRSIIRPFELITTGLPPTLFKLNLLLHLLLGR